MNTRTLKHSTNLFVLLLLAAGCAPRELPEELRPNLVDPNATYETQALFVNLDRIRADHVLFGHQDDLAYGVHWLRERGRSDVREVAGSYPAVYGWELGDFEYGAEQNLDGVNFRDMRRWIMEGYRRGGVITIGWHMNNPASGGNAWDTTRAIHTVLPGGEHHDMYRGWLDRFAGFVSGMRTGPLSRLGIGGPVPIIFRPFHEQTGSWFWWGRDSVTPEEFAELWRFTVRYLRDEKGVNNLLYAYSTDVFRDEAQYLEHYPGDNYVDILGFDDYQAWRMENGVETIADRLRQLVEMAEARGKIPALTETGFETIPDSTWWTERFGAGIKHDPVGQRIAYALVWRNANHQNDRPDHYYAPYPGHASAENFVEFRHDPVFLFEDDLPDMYRVRDNQ